MAYTEHSLRIALRSLPLNPPRWVWDARAQTPAVEAAVGRVRSLASSMPPMVRFRFELWRYCWGVYSLAAADAGDRVIGGEWDADAFSPSAGHEKWARVNAGWGQVARRAGLYAPAGGGAPRMDKWHPVLNDCWLLGGVHRLAPFRLVSTRRDGGGADRAAATTAVTAREVLGLRRFGYAPDLRLAASGVIFRPSNPALALSASLESYAAALASPPAARSAMLREML